MLLSGKRLSFVLTVASMLCLLGGQAARAQFVDDFNRSDSGNLGNGWIEKSPAAFTLNAGAVEKQSVASSYRNNIVFRPASENLLDVETSVEFTVRGLPPRYPQLLARVQTDTALLPDSFDGYIMYVPNSEQDVVVGRQNGGNFVTTLANINTWPDLLNLTDRFRLRMSVIGTNPVDIVASVERFNGTGWDVIGQAVVSDFDANRIDTAGSTGFGGSSFEDEYIYDNFQTTDLGGGASNPFPQLTGITPNAASAGDPGFTLIVNGSDFSTSSVVRWNGADRPTTYVSAGQLTANIGAMDIAAIGSASVTVFTPAPGGGISAAQTFTIDPAVVNNPQPVLNQMTPANVLEGSPAFSLTVDGSDFVASSTVRWNGQDRATIFVSASQLTADINAADVAAAGSATVTVFSPAPGGGTSAGQVFAIDPATVTNPLPVLNNVAPASVTEGSPAFTLTVNGTDFVDSSVVRWNGTNRPTTFVSAGQLLADIGAADVATAGTASITVFSPAPGGGLSASTNLTIDPAAATNPAPVLATISPTNVTAGSGGFTLGVTGSDFIAASTVRWNGQDRPTTFVSAGSLTATIPASDVALAGIATVTVSTPAPGGGISGGAIVNIASPPTGSDVIDSFDRSDSSDIGNGWVEKSPNAFSLNAGSVEKLSVGTSYRDNIVFRPAAENLLDVETSVEFRLNAVPPRYPQLFARVQSNTALWGDYLDAYILYISNSTQDAVFGRQSGGSFVTTLGSLAIAPALNTTDTYRLRLIVTGTDPVNVTASVDRLNGTVWDVVAQGSVDDFDAARIQTAGSVGFGGSSSEDEYRYDNFRRVDLGGGPGGDNPLPQVSSLDPGAATAGDPGFDLTVNGSDFVASSVVRWNGTDRTTTFVSDSVLTAAIDAADIATIGSANVTVFSPLPGGGESGSLPFAIDAVVVNNPPPLIGTLQPGSVDEGNGSFVMTVTGAQFVDTSIVRWNGQDRPTTYVSANELSVLVGAADVAAPGTANVAVFSPGPGGGVSAALTFTINAVVPTAPLPVLTSIAPTGVNEGTGAFTLRVLGSDFTATSVIRWNGQDRATTFVSQVELVAAIGANDVAAAGTAPVSVFTPAPGGGLSAAIDFTIFDTSVGPFPAPYVNAIWPVDAEAGTADILVTVIGGGFGDFSQAMWGGQPRPTYFRSPEELLVQISAADLSAAGFFGINVENPAPGGGISNSSNFEVLAATGNPLAPRLANVSPEFVTAGSGAATLTLTGSEFTVDSTALWNGVARTTTFVSSSVLEVTIPASDVASGQAASISVTTPAPGGGNSDPQTFFVQETAASFFYDNFERADSPAVGNGWTEESADAFRVLGGMLVSQQTTYDYRDAVVSRPQAEDRSDVEVSVEFTRAIQTENFPQVHARIQRDAPQTPETLHSYLLFVNEFAGDPGNAVIAIQPPVAGEVECFMATIPFPERLQFGERYRLRFRVMGSLPVQLTGFVDHFNGASWDVMASGTTIHDNTTQPDPNLFCGPGYMPAPISDAGAIGVSKFRNRSDLYDNFYWRDVDSNLNPLPGISTLSPSTATAGDPAFTMLVDGTDFVAGSVVRWNGADRPTTFISSNQLSADITAQDLAQAATVDVTVFSPAPGGGESPPEYFTVLSPSTGGSVLDDFERADSAVLGNGWQEKNPGAFTLAGGEAVKLNVSQSYTENIVYRPAAENTLDAEASVEFRLFSLAPGYPQLFTRVQTDTAGTQGSLDAYILYVNNSANEAVLGRQLADNFVEALSVMGINPGLNATDRYRMRLSATNTNPVLLSAFIDRWNGSDWDVIGQTTAADGAFNRIDTAGTGGFGGYLEGNYAFDNFDVIVQ